MKTLISAVVFFFTMHQVAYSANYFAVANGDWGDANTWATSPGGTAGAGVPGTGDIAITSGFSIGLNPVYGDVTVDRITVTNTVANSIYFNDPFFIFTPVTLTINQSLSSTGAPTAQVIENSSFINLVIAGTGSTVINSWSTSSPFNTIAFSAAGTTTLNTDIAISGTASISSGTTLEIGSSNFIASSGGSSTISVASGGTLDVLGAISGGSAATNFGTVTNNGTINIGSNAYLNSSTFNINTNSVLNVGNNQPNGWWESSSPGPTSVPIDVNSTINYNRLGAQGVAVGTYGNLTMLTGSGTKTLGSTGALVVLGNLTIGGSSTFDTSTNGSTINLAGDVTNDGVWLPTQQINFNGSAAQSVTGNNMITFGGGVRISNTSGNIQFVGVNGDINGAFTIDAGATFNPNGRTVNLAGDLAINGTLTASGTFDFDGSTSVSGSGAAAFNNVIITGTLSALGQLATISGDFTNNGNLFNLNGSVDFNGTISQNISGSATNNFYNLTISNSAATVSNNATTNLFTAMTLASNATFDADGSGSGVFTIRSTSGTNTARVEAIPSGASITGNVVVQRYFNLTSGAIGTGVWRNFGVAVNGATVAQITSAGFTINGNDLAREDETIGGPVNDRFELQSSFGSSIANNEGYTMFTRNADVDAAIDFAGTLNQGTQSMPITYTSSGNSSDDGWNLVNNPFPSTVDWDNMNRSGNISGSVSVWNTDTDTYDTWNGSTGGLSNGLIASGQAFWVQTTGAGATLSIPESAKSSSSATFLKTSGEEITNQLIVSLLQEDKIDKTFIHFREDATDSFEYQLDSRKLANGIFNMASLSTEDEILAINSLSPIDNCSKEIKLYIDQELWDDVKKENYRGFIPGNYQLSFEGLSTFTQSFNFTLIDSLENNQVLIPLDENTIYDFLVDTTKVNSWGGDRFTIQFSEKAIDSNVDYTSVVTCDSGTEVTFINTQSGITYAIEHIGDLIVEGVADGTDLTLNIPEDNVVVGTNIFDVNLKNGTCSNVSLKNKISFESTEVVEISSVEDGLSCGFGSVLLKADGATGNAYYNWYESLEATDPIPNQISGEFLTPEIDATKYYYVTIVNEAGCESTTRTKVVANIVNLETPDLIWDGISEFSTSVEADNYRWYKDGELIQGENGQTFIASESGSYSVEIEANTCMASSENIAITILGINELKEFGISVYPNPVYNALHVESTVQKINAVILYDTKGVELERFEGDIPSEINMNTLKKGIYIINIVTTNQTITSRVRKK